MCGHVSADMANSDIFSAAGYFFTRQLSFVCMMPVSSQSQHATASAAGQLFKAKVTRHLSVLSVLPAWRAADRLERHIYHITEAFVKNELSASLRKQILLNIRFTVLHLLAATDGRMNK